MNYLAPSLLAADFTRLGEQMRIIDRAGAQYFHYDVMDGMFVPNISMGLHGDNIRTRIRKIADVALGLFDHQMHIQLFLRHLPDRL